MLYVDRESESIRLLLLYPSSVSGLPFMVGAFELIVNSNCLQTLVLEFICEQHAVAFSRLLARLSDNQRIKLQIACPEASIYSSLFTCCRLDHLLQGGFCSASFACDCIDCCAKRKTRTKTIPLESEIVIEALR